MDYQNIFQLTMQEKQDLFSALNKIDYDPTGGDLYIYLVKSSMMSSLSIRIISTINKQRTPINPKPIYSLGKLKNININILTGDYNAYLSHLTFGIIGI
ncbi:hypothetical protein [Photorhabdus akhurstii]|uniref:hypothetical protein n=1 Tax=Photorhabdus akhurstii TaxID=171438 RepID=UPI000D42170A|nr:hypothetical protein C6H69_06805 [Photorhabdus luminescens]